MRAVHALAFFRTTLLEFLESLGDRFPGEKADFDMARGIIEHVPVNDLISSFHFFCAAKEGEFMRRVEERDASYLLEHNVFDAIAGSDYFESMWYAIEDEDTRNVIWSWVDALVYAYRDYCDATYVETGSGPIFEVPAYITHNYKHLYSTNK